MMHRNPTGQLPLLINRFENVFTKIVVAVVFFRLLFIKEKSKGVKKNSVTQPCVRVNTDKITITITCSIDHI